MSAARLTTLTKSFLFHFDDNFRTNTADNLFHLFCVAACLNGREEFQFKQHLQSQGVL